MNNQWNHDDIQSLVTNLTLPEFWVSCPPDQVITYYLAQQIIVYIQKSEFHTVNVRLPVVLEILGHPPITHIFNVIRKVNNKFAKATKAGQHILSEPINKANIKPIFHIGERCDASGITEEWLNDESTGVEPLHVEITNLHVLELINFRNLCGVTCTYEVASKWIKRLCHLDAIPNDHTLRSNWIQLRKKHFKLAGKKQNSFDNEMYRPPSSSTIPNRENVTFHTMVEKVLVKMEMLQSAYTRQMTKIDDLKSSNVNLIGSLQEETIKKKEAEAKHSKLKKMLADLQDCNNYLLDEVRSLDKVNAKCTITRHENQLLQCQQELAVEEERANTLQEINEKLNSKLETITTERNTEKKRLHDKVHYYKKKYRKLSNNSSNDNFLEQYMQEINCLKNEGDDNDLKSKLDELMQQDDISTFQNGKYSDEVRMVCYELLSCGVGTNHISNVICNVLKTLTGINLDILPKPTLLKYMATLSSLLAKAAAVSTMESTDGSGLSLNC